MALTLIFLTHKASSAPIVVYSSNNFTLETTSSLVFQHLGSTFGAQDFEVTFTVDSGTFNASPCSLYMYESTGVLRVNTNDTCTLFFYLSDSNIAFKVNRILYENASFLNVASNTNYVFEWYLQGEEYISLSLGILGLGIIICTPVFSIYKIKKDKDYLWIVYSLALLTVGGAFVASWLGAV